MEHKKTLVATILMSVLIIALIVISYFYSDFNKNQEALLTEEANKILQADLSTYNIDFETKTDKNYAKVENSIKEYISKLKNIYVDMEELSSGINPNTIFSVQNISNKKLEGIDAIVDEYKEKSQNFISEYEILVTDEKIQEHIDNADISTRRNYYTNLYNEIMLSDVMKNQYNKLDEELKNEKGRLYEKLNKVEKMKVFLEDNENSWTIKENKIQFSNLNRMTEYYNLLNQIIID